MRPSLALLLAILFVSIPIQSASTDDAPQTPEALARELIRISGAVESTDDMMAAYEGQFRMAFPDVPAELWSELFASMNANELVELVIPIYTKHYTREDLVGLIEFYQSPLGQRLIKANPAIMQESMAVGMAWGQQKAAEVFESLRERGYEPVNI